VSSRWFCQRFRYGYSLLYIFTHTHVYIYMIYTHIRIFIYTCIYEICSRVSQLVKGSLVLQGFAKSAGGGVQEVADNEYRSFAKWSGMLQCSSCRWHETRNPGGIWCPEMFDICLWSSLLGAFYIFYDWAMRLYLNGCPVFGKNIYQQKAKRIP
jgi:hypothetical protein